MSPRTEGTIIFNAARVIRKYMFESDEVLDGDISEERQKGSVSKQLLLLICSILEDSKDFEFSNSTLDLSLKLAQLIRFNTVKTKRKGNNFRHSKDNEPPLPVKVGLSIHSKTREKSLIDDLFSMGLSISYERVISIEDNITKSLCKKYNDEEVVCPPDLEPDTFISGAIDNLDHNPTSATSNTAYHGTSISIFQFPNEPMQPKCFKYTEVECDKAPSLPESYTQIQPTKEFKPEPPNRIENKSESHEALSDTKIEGMDLWKLRLANLSTGDDEGDKASFATFFDQNSVSSMPKTKSTLLPLINESINSTATVRHCTEVIMRITGVVNPSQKTIITADQPVYTLGKQVQWMYQEKYQNVVWLMGPLHIEMSFMNGIGSWLEDSGWIEAFERSNISTPGRIESFLNGSKVKRCRYAHQVSLVALSKLAFEAFENQSQHTDFEMWKQEMIESNANFCYWFHVIDMEMLLFAFIRSLRDADFPAFLNALRLITKWIFILNHVHYARWLPVFIKDLEDLDPPTFCLLYTSPSPRDRG